MKTYEQEFKNNFWREFFEHFSNPGHSFLIRLEQKYGMTYQEEDYFTIVVVDLPKEPGREWDSFSVSDFVQELQKNVLEQSGISLEAFFSIKKQAAVFLLYSEKTQFLPHFIQRLCQRMLQYYNRQCNRNCCFYYKENIQYSKVYEAYQDIEAVFRHDVILYNRVINVDEYNEKKSQYSNPSMKEWELLLANNKVEDLTGQVMEFYQRLAASGTLTIGGAKSFRMDILQLLYCADCGAKLTYRSPSAQHRPDGKTYDSDNAFICGGYRGLHRDCTMHYIKVSVVEELVKKAIHTVSSFAIENEGEFIRRLEVLSDFQAETAIKENKKALSTAERRVKELDELIRKLYEGNATGKIPDKHFERMLAEYDSEQSALEGRIEEIKNSIAEYEKNTVRTDKFMEVVRKLHLRK